MADDDYRALIAELEAQFVQIGAPELADETYYTFRDENTGEERLLEPRRRLIAMLWAFDRFLAVRDSETYRDAIVRLQEYTHGGGPERVSFAPVADTIATDLRDLSSIPDLSDLRRHVRLLIEQL
jgi:hypothetical protein